MPARRHLARGAVTAIALASSLAGCDFSGIGGLGDVTSAIGPTLVSVTVTGDTVVAAGDTVRLSAVGGVGGGLGFLFAGDRLLDATWSSTDPSIATVDVRRPPAGDSISTIQAIVRGRRVGTTQLRAEARGKRGELTVRVVPAAQ